MQRAALVTIGIIAIFLVALFLIFMSIRGRNEKQNQEKVIISVTPDGAAFKGPSAPPPGFLRDESPQPQSEIKSVDGDILPMLE